MVDVSKKNDKKVTIVRGTCKLVDPVLSRYAGRKVDKTIVDSMNALHGHVRKFSVHCNEWLSKKGGAFYGIKKI